MFTTVTKRNRFQKFKPVITPDSILYELKMQEYARKRAQVLTDSGRLLEVPRWYSTKELDAVG